MIRTFKKQAAQGDLFIKKIDKLPNNVKKVKPQEGMYIVAHSETGHHHVIVADPGVELYEENESDGMTLYMKVIDATEVTLKHLRGWDTHDPIGFTKGIFKFRRARERIPEGWRKAAD